MLWAQHHYSHCKYILLLFALLGCQSEHAAQPATDLVPEATKIEEGQTEVQQEATQEGGQETTSSVAEQSPSELRSEKAPFTAASPKENAPSQSDEPEQQSALQSVTKMASERLQDAQEKLQETQDVVIKWVDAARFWDLNRRILALAYQQPAELTDEETQFFTQLLTKAIQLERDFQNLYDHCRARNTLALSEAIRADVISKIENGTPIPPELRKALQFVRNNEQNLSFGLEQEDRLSQLRESLVFDELSEGHLLELYLCLRGRLADLVALRKHEDIQDIIFLCYPTHHLQRLSQGNGDGLNLKRATLRGMYPQLKRFGQTKPARVRWNNEELTPLEIKEIFEFLGEDPPSNTQRPQRNLSNSRFVPRVHDESLNVPLVRSQQEFKSLFAACDRLKKLLSKTDYNFLFPEQELPRSREALLEIAQKLYDQMQVGEANARKSAVAVMQMRMHEADFARAMERSKQNDLNNYGLIDLVAKLQRSVEFKENFKQTMKQLEQSMIDGDIDVIRARHIRFMNSLYAERQYRFQEAALDEYLTRVADELHQVSEFLQ